MLKRIGVLANVMVLVVSMSLTFPVSPTGKLTELLIDGTWTEVTPREASQVVIKRGRKNEKQRTSPTSLDCVLSNLDGNLSNRNAASPYYGKLGKNIQMRQTVFGLSYLETSGASTFAKTADHASLDITGDIDIRIDLALTDWTDVGFAAKYLTTGNQRSWAFYMDSTKHPVFFWSTDGTFAGGTSVASGVAISTGDGERVSLRVTMDVNNGSGQKVITFYTGSSVDGPWTTLDTLTSAGTTSIFASTAEVEVGGVSLLGPVWSTGKIYRFQLYSNIGGTLVANPVFEDLQSDVDFADSLGRTWDANTARFVPNSVRCVVEVPFMGQRWDTSGRDLYVPIQGSGILRRLGQGQRPLRSAVWREITFNNPLAFWPLNDGDNATALSSGLASGAPMSILIPGYTSQQINAWTEPMITASGNQSPAFEGRINQSISATEWTGDFTYAFSTDAGTANVTVEFGGNGEATAADPKNYWLLNFTDDGSVLDYELSVVSFTTSTSSQTLLTSGSLEHLDGRVHHARIITDNNGANTDWDLVIDGTTIASGTTAAPWDPAHYTLMDINANTGWVALGMVTAWGSASPPGNVANAAVVGRSGELGAHRFVRLCEEENIAYEVVGTAADSEAMGPQKIDTLLNNLYDIEDVDHGVLGEPRYFLGLQYQVRTSLYESENTFVEVDYAEHHLSKELFDNDDDSHIRNDIEITRPGGSSYRVIQETGPNNIQDPTVDPQGVGLYDEAPTVNMDSDSQLSSIAEWRKHLGTFDEQARFTAVVFELHRREFTSNPQLTIDVASLDMGHYLKILNPKHPPLAPEDLELTTDQYMEIISNLTWELNFNTNPSGRYRVGVFDASTSRYSSINSTLGEDLTTTETDVTVAIANIGSFWVTGSSAPEFPFDIMIDGERMTVTAIAAPSGQTQVFTVTRSVNGIVKTHTTGGAIELLQARRFGF